MTDEIDSHSQGATGSVAALEYEAVLSALGVGAAVVDANLVLVSATPRSRHLLGFGPAMVGSKLSELGGDPSFSRLGTLVQAVMRADERMELRIRGAHGEPCELSIDRYYPDGADAPSALLIARNIDAEEQNERRLERFEFIVDTAAEMIGVLDREARYQYVNRAFADRYGLDRKSIAGLSMSSLDPEWTRERFQSMFDKAHADGPQMFETTNVPTSAERYPAEVSVTPVVLGGEPVVVTVSRDITERRRADRQREMLREVAGLAMERRSSSVIVQDILHAMVRGLDAELVQVWRYSPRTSPTLTPTCSSPEGHDTCRPFEFAQIEAAWKAKRSSSNGSSFVTPIGRSNSADDILAVRLANGRRLGASTVSAIEGIARKIALFIKTRNSIAQLELRDRALEAASDGVVIADLTAHGSEIIFVNAAFERMTGFSEGEAMGRDFRMLLGPDTEPDAVMALDNAIETQSSAQITMLNYRKNGEPFWNDLHVAPVDEVEDGRQHVVAVFHDISDRIEIERDLLDARQRATSANRAKSRFLANMSHEIRSPMTAILGFSDALARETREPETKERAATIQRNADYLLRLIGDILDISKIEAGRFSIEDRAFDLERMLVDVRDLLTVRADAQEVPLNFELLSALPKNLISDETRLRQILVNLVANAIKFTEEGRVDALFRYTPDLQVQSAGSVTIRVADTGIGIPAESLERIFEPFSRPHAESAVYSAAYDGSGLGLSIVRRLVRALGGTIDVSSVVGEGTTFVVKVPVAVDASGGEFDRLDEAAGREPTTQTETVPRLDGLRVLVADDRADVADVVRFYLEDAGAEVVTVSDGSLAVKAVEARGTKFDAVVLDMQMPVMDGFEAASRLRSLGYDGPVIALTAGATKEDEVRCISAGCTNFLAKPAEELELLQVIATAVG